MLRELTMDEIGSVAGGRMQDRSPMPNGGVVTVTVGGSSGSSSGTDWAAEAGRLQRENDRASGSPND